MVACRKVKGALSHHSLVPSLRTVCDVVFLYLNHISSLHQSKVTKRLPKSRWDFREEKRLTEIVTKMNEFYLIGRKEWKPKPHRQSGMNEKSEGK